MTGLGDISFHPVCFQSVALGVTLLCLLAMSGFISGSESAFFSLTPKEKAALEESESQRDKTILKMQAEPKRLLATILIANNLVNVFTVMLSAYFMTLVVDFGEAEAIKFIVETIIITAFLLLFGEIMPKILATQHHVSFARLTAMPLYFAERLMHPFSSLLMLSTTAVNKRMERHQANMSADDISQALEITSDSMSDEKDMLEGIVKFMDLDVSDIMTPRVDVESVGYEWSFNRVLRTVVESGYSRLPVIGDTPDDIKGILYVKDILPYINKDDNTNWNKTIRKCFFIPETKKVNDLLTEFQTTKTHMAIIVDEYGCMQGIVTLEDIMEEIVGDISDEQDDEERDWYRQPDGSIVFEGKILLNDFFKVLDIDGEIFDKVRGDAETLAGLLLEKNGTIPHKKEIIEIGRYRFEIVSADMRKINKIKVTEIAAPAHPKSQSART